MPNELLDGDYDCVDSIVLNGYFPLGNSPGWFRCRWRQLTGSDATLAALMVLREKVLWPLLARAGKLRTGPKPRHRHILDAHYESIQREFQQLFKTLQIAA